MHHFFACFFLSVIHRPEDYRKHRLLRQSMFPKCECPITYMDHGWPHFPPLRSRAGTAVSEIPGKKT